MFLCQDPSCLPCRTEKYCFTFLSICLFFKLLEIDGNVDKMSFSLQTLIRQNKISKIFSQIPDIQLCELVITKISVRHAFKMFKVFSAENVQLLFKLSATKYQ